MAADNFTVTIAFRMYLLVALATSLLISSSVVYGDFPKLYSEVTAVEYLGHELVHEDLVSVFVQVELEYWSTYSTPIEIRFIEDLGDGGEVYHCGLRIGSSSNSSFSFDSGFYDTNSYNCIVPGTISPGFSEDSIHISGYRNTSDPDYENIQTDLVFEYTSQANHSETLFDQTYNATLNGPDFILISDPLPESWGNKTAVGTDRIFVRMKSAQLREKEYRPGRTEFSFLISGRLVNNHDEKITVGAPCTHLLDFIITADTSAGSTQVSYPGVCATAISAHDIEPGMTEIDQEMDLELLGIHSELPSGTYQFTINAKMHAYGMTWIVGTDSIQTIEAQPETSYRAVNQNDEEILVKIDFVLVILPLMALVGLKYLKMKTKK